MSPPTKTTPKPTNIHPLTPTQTTDSPSPSPSVPPRRRSLRLASISNSEPPQSPTVTTPEPPTARVSEPKMQKSNLTASELEPSLNLRSGKKVVKRGIAITKEDEDSEKNDSKRNKKEENRSGKKVLKRGITITNEDEDSENNDSKRKKKEEENRSVVKIDEDESSQRRILTREDKGKEKENEIEDEDENENEIKKENEIEDEIEKVNEIKKETVVVDDERVEFGVALEIENNMGEVNEEVNVLEQVRNADNNAREERGVEFNLNLEIENCRGDFRTPSYWLALVLKNNDSPPNFNLSKGREKDRINP